MKYLERDITKNIIKKLQPNKVVIVFGARRAGKTVLVKDVRLFAQVSGDYNPLHLVEEYASTTCFKQRIAHGMLVGGILSGVLGNKLPGPGTIYLSQTINFKSPVFLGDSIMAEVEVVEKIKAKMRLRLKTVCFNQAGKVVLEGEAVVQKEEHDQ